MRLIGQLDAALEAAGYFHVPLRSNRVNAQADACATMLTKPGWSVREIQEIRS